MNNFQNQYSNTQPNNQNNQQTNFQGQSNAQTQQPPSIMMKLMSSCLPVLLEQFTGQAMSPMGGGNNVETQLALSQIVNMLQNLDQRLTSLESNSSQQFTGLAQKIESIKSIRLTHDRERKQIEFNGDSNFQQQQEN